MNEYTPITTTKTTRGSRKSRSISTESKRKSANFLVKFADFWRSGWDSNPRAGVTGKLISSRWNALVFGVFSRHLCASKNNENS